MTLSRPDFLVSDRDGNLVMVVEVSIRLNHTRETAARYWSNLNLGSVIQSALYVMLVTPNRIFIWHGAVNNSINLPDEEFDTWPLLQSYFSGSGTDPYTISEVSFAMLVSAWLYDLSLNDSQIALNGSHGAWLAAIRGGNVNWEVLA
jgi:hypothetical protein